MKKFRITYRLKNERNFVKDYTITATGKDETDTLTNLKPKYPIEIILIEEI